MPFSSWKAFNISLVNGSIKNITKNRNADDNNKNLIIFSEDIYENFSFNFFII